MEQSMSIKELAQEIHENAVAHGWWDEPRTDAEIIALIHSEWSEALEESRAGRPMVWHNCDVCEDEYGTKFCETATEEACINLSLRKTCKYRSSKPEGIAVELIDGVIRILDYMATQNYDIQNAVFDEHVNTFILPPNGRLTGTELDAVAGKARLQQNQTV